MRPLHPTIVVGYGRYGLRCLQLLLAGAAARGLLAWDDNPEIAAINERQLSTLALFWIPDVLRLEEQAVRPLSQTQDGFEMMQDLYAQIEPLEADDKQLPTIVAQSLESAKKRLFDEFRRVRHEREITLGLDVIVLAQPTHESVLGKLREIVSPAVKQLASDRGLSSPGTGQDLLNFIQILDFENYWSASHGGVSIRGALRQMAGASEQAARQDQPGFGRIYLFDGQTSRGNHEESLRIEEAVLFLDFLLFEGQRAAKDYRFLFQREEQGTAAICAVGIRAIERGTEKLRRLAAASFARGWLEYLIGNHEPARHSALRELVEPLLPGHQGNGDENKEDREIEPILDGIQQQLLAIDFHQEDWPVRVRSRCSQLVAESKDELTRGALVGARAEMDQQVSDLRSRVEEAISGMLVTSQSPVTLGSVLAETDQLLSKLSPNAMPEPPTLSLSQETGPDLDALHTRFRAFRDSQVEPGRLKNLWPLMSIALSLAYLPLMRDFLASLFGDDWGPLWVQAMVPGVAIAVGSWLAASKLFHPRIARRAERALEFFTDSDRGRRSDAIGVLVASGGVRGELAAHLKTGQWAQRARMISEIGGVLRHVRSSLVQRRCEIEWLNSQLLRYLDIHGVDSSSDVPQFRLDRRTSPVIRTIEGQPDLDRIAFAVPRKSAEFRDMQRKLKIFSRWEKRFCDTFLEPHRFLDRLGAFFPTAESSGDRSEIQPWVKQLGHSIRDISQFPVGFYWHSTDGLPQRLRYSAIPSTWARMDPVSQQLSDDGYVSRLTTMGAGERLYLIQSQMGVPKELLTGSEA